MIGLIVREWPQVEKAEAPHPGPGEEVVGRELAPGAALARQTRTGTQPRARPEGEEWWGGVGGSDREGSEL